MVLVKKISPLTGELNEMVLDVTQEQLDEFYYDPNRRLIQQIFPQLSEVEREFLQTGYTASDWRVIHGE
tara:strand:+ start:251 stop:457 length:207 start_codon:yes stop_codon:yes gene_type:complete